MNVFNLHSERYFRFSLIVAAAYFSITGLAMLPYLDFTFGTEGFLRGTTHPLAAWVGAALISPVVLATQLLSIISAFFLPTRARVPAALIILLIQIFQMHLNPYSPTPEVEFTGFLLLLIVFLPGPNSENRVHFKNLKEVAWVVLSLGYLSAGLSKALDSVWISGDAIQFILTDCPISTSFGHWFADHFGRLPCRTITYVIIFFQSTFWVSYFVPRLRIVYLIVTSLLHVNIFFALTMAQVSAGMLLYHLFVLDFALHSPKWWYRPGLHD